MGTANSRCDAVLIFDKRRLYDGDVLVRLTEKSLRQKGYEVEVSDEESHGEILMQVEGMVVTIKTDTDETDLMGRMMIAISDINTSLHADAPLVLLADICRKAILATEASQIVWLRKDVVFSAQQYLSAFAPVKPRRVDMPISTTATRPAPRRVANGRAHQTNGQRLPHIDSMEDKLDQKFRTKAAQNAQADHWSSFLTEEEESALADAIHVDENGRHDEEEVQLSRPTRITTWIMTSMMMFFSLPLAAFFIVYNFFKGEDFRLSAHALGLAGTFAVLNASGATAATASLLLG